MPPHILASCTEIMHIYNDHTHSSKVSVGSFILHCHRLSWAPWGVIHKSDNTGAQVSSVDGGGLTKCRKMCIALKSIAAKSISISRLFIIFAKGRGLTRTSFEKANRLLYDESKKDYMVVQFNFLRCRPFLRHKKNHII